MNCVYTALWNLKCSLDKYYPWVVTERNSRIYPTSAVASKFARFESSWLQCVMTIAREGVQNTPLTCTNWNSDWEQSGAIRPKVVLCHHCRSHSSVASLIVPERWCVFCTPSLCTFSTCCYQLYSNLGNSEPGHSWGGINSGVFFL